MLRSPLELVHPLGIPYLRNKRLEGTSHLKELLATVVSTVLPRMTPRLDLDTGETPNCRSRTM
jgi:hypothetical protein